MRWRIRNGSVAPEPTSAALSPVREASSVRKPAGMNGFVTGTTSSALMRPPGATSAEVASPAVRAWPGAAVMIVEIGVGASAAAANWCRCSRTA